MSSGRHGAPRLDPARWRRVAGDGGGHLLAAVELKRHDGPWVRPDDARTVNGILRYSRGDAQNGVSVMVLGYWSDWDATDPVPARAIADGRISRFGRESTRDMSIGTASPPWPLFRPGVLTSPW